MVYGLPCLSSSVCSAVRYNIQAPENCLIQCPSAQRFEELEESCQNYGGSQWVGNGTYKFRHSMQNFDNYHQHHNSSMLP